MKHLEIFNSVKVFEGHEIKRNDLERIQYAGYLTLSQSGSSKSLIRGVQMAFELGISSINVVNVEDSAVTRVASEFGDDSDSIGMYMKSGFCYSDLKSFIPQVISLAMVALWFSDKKTSVINHEIRERRMNMIREIECLPKNMAQSLSPQNQS